MDMPNIKTGLLTTQFWIAAIPTAVALWGQLKGFIPQPYASWVEISCVALYTITRTAHVAMVQIHAIKAQSAQTTVTTTEPVTTVTTPA